MCACVRVCVCCLTLTNRASTIPNNTRGCQFSTPSQRGAKVNWSNGIHLTTRFLPAGPTTREHRKLINIVKRGLWVRTTASAGGCPSELCPETLRVKCGEDGVGRRKSGPIAYRATSGCLEYICMYVWSSHIAEYGSTG